VKTLTRVWCLPFLVHHVFTNYIQNYRSELISYSIFNTNLSVRDWSSQVCLQLESLLHTAAQLHSAGTSPSPLSQPSTNHSSISIKLLCLHLSTNTSISQSATFNLCRCHDVICRDIIMHSVLYFLYFRIMLCFILFYVLCLSMYASFCCNKLIIITIIIIFQLPRDYSHHGKTKITRNVLDGEIYQPCWAAISNLFYSRGIILLPSGEYRNYCFLSQKYNMKCLAVFKNNSPDMIIKVQLSHSKMQYGDEKLGQSRGRGYWIASQI